MQMHWNEFNRQQVAANHQTQHVEPHWEQNYQVAGNPHPQVFPRLPNYSPHAPPTSTTTSTTTTAPAGNTGSPFHVAPHTLYTQNVNNVIAEPNVIREIPFNVEAVSSSGLVLPQQAMVHSSKDATHNDAPALSGATSAAIHNSLTGGGTHQSGTRTTFTGNHPTAGVGNLTAIPANYNAMNMTTHANVTPQGTYGKSNIANIHNANSVTNVPPSLTSMGVTTNCSNNTNNNNTAAVAAAAAAGIAASSNGNNGVGIALDNNEEEISQLLQELESAVDTPRAAAVMQDVIESIETRALGNLDPFSRDIFLEQRIREVINNLSHSNNERALSLAAHFIETLLPIPYTNAQQKFTRLCRSLTTLLECGNEKQAREAQRIFKKMLEVDKHFDSSEPPLKAFILKELRDNCEQAIMRLHGSTQQSSSNSFNAQYISIMLISSATAEVNAAYLTGQLRNLIIQLATILAGVIDPVLPRVAYECLVAVFANSSALRHNEVVIENRRVCEEALRCFSASHHMESSVLAPLKALRALLTARGLQCVDKQGMQTLCRLVTEQQRITKSVAIRAAVCDLVPIIAPIDITVPGRRAIYCAIIMEPAKNVRDESRKTWELQNVAFFIDSVGHLVLDRTSSTNLVSIIQRYISRRVTQEVCWQVIAALSRSYHREASREVRHSHRKKKMQQLHLPSTAEENNNNNFFNTHPNPHNNQNDDATLLSSTSRSSSQTNKTLTSPNNNVVAATNETAENNNNNNNTSSFGKNKKKATNSNQRESTEPSERSQSSVRTEKAANIVTSELEEEEEESKTHGTRQLENNKKEGIISNKGTEREKDHNLPTNEDHITKNRIRKSVAADNTGKDEMVHQTTPFENAIMAASSDYAPNSTNASTSSLDSSLESERENNVEHSQSPHHHLNHHHEERDKLINDYEDKVNYPRFDASYHCTDLTMNGPDGNNNNNSSNVDGDNNNNNNTTKRSSSQSTVCSPLIANAMTNSPTGFPVGGLPYHIADLIRPCIAYLSRAMLSAELVKHLQEIIKCVPEVKKEIEEALNKLVDAAIKRSSTSPIGASNNTNTNNTKNMDIGMSSVTSLTSASSIDDARHQIAASALHHKGNMEAIHNILTSQDTHMRTTSTGNASQQIANTNVNVDSISTPSSTSATKNSTVAAVAAAVMGSVNSPNTPDFARSSLGRLINLNRNITNSFGEALMTAHPTALGISSGLYQMEQVGASANIVTDLIVALEMFSHRPVTSVQQLEEIKTLIIPYQRHENIEVRKQSSATIIASLRDWIRYAKEHRTSTYSSRVIEILEAYVKYVLLEMDPTCRLEEITLLASAANLRPFLSEQRILSALLSFLNSTPAVREKTVQLLIAITQDAKLSSSVEAVQKSLDVTIESCVVVLEYTTDVHTLIRNMADLQTFTKLCVRPLSKHLSRIFYAFRKRLSDETITDVVSLFILKTLETILVALAKDERAILQYQDDVVELYEPLVHILKQSSSPSLSHAAINALVYMNKMCPSTIHANVQKLQNLIHTIVHVYTGSSSTQEERVNMLTLFGQLGALNPSMHVPVVAVTATSANKKKSDEIVMQEALDLELNSDYTVIVYRTLCRMLDVTLSEAVCMQTLRALIQFMHFTNDKKELVGGVHAVRAVLQIAKRATDSLALRVEALRTLSTITTLRHERIARLILPEVVVLLEQLWNPNDVLTFREVLGLVSALKPGKLSGKEQSESWAWLYPRLVDVALQDRTECREFCLRVVEIILNASYIPPQCIPIVFPVLIQFVRQSDQLPEVRSQSLCGAVHIVCDLKAVQYFSSLLHGIRTLARHCELNSELGVRLSTTSVRESLKVLSALHPSGRPIIKMLRNCLSNHDERAVNLMSNATLSTAVYNNLGPFCPGNENSLSTITTNTGSNTNTSTAPSVSNNMLDSINSNSSLVNNVSMLGNVNGPPIPTGLGQVGGNHPTKALGMTFLRGNSLERSMEDEPLNIANTHANSSGNTRGQEIALFMKHIELGFRVKENKLREWFAEFQKTIVLVSPHPAFRMIVDLFDKHKPLRRELFHPSFKSLYEVLSAEQIKKVKDMLTIVLNCNDNELASACLGLADYLDHSQPKIKPEILEELRLLESAESRYSQSNSSSSLSMRFTSSAHNMLSGGNNNNSNNNTNNNVNNNNNFMVATNNANNITFSGMRINRQVGNVKAGHFFNNNSNVNNVDQGDNWRQVHNNNQSIGNPGMFNFDFSGNSDSEMIPAQCGTNNHTAIPSLRDDVRVQAKANNLIARRMAQRYQEENKNNNLNNNDSDEVAVLASNFQPLGRGFNKNRMFDLTGNYNNNTNNNNINNNGISNSNSGTSNRHRFALRNQAALRPDTLFSSENIVKAAERTRMYDKALSYLEGKLHIALETYSFTKMPQSVMQRVVWPLAWLYSQREMQDSVVGLFRAIHYKGESSDGFSLELLRLWKRAQRVYARVVSDNVLQTHITFPALLEGYVRTLTFCGEWSKVLKVAKTVCYLHEDHSSHGTNAIMGIPNDNEPGTPLIDSHSHSQHTNSSLTNATSTCESNTVNNSNNNIISVGAWHLPHSATVTTCGAMAAWMLGEWNDVQELANLIPTTELNSGASRLFYVNGAMLHAAVEEYKTSALILANVGGSGSSTSPVFTATTNNSSDPNVNLANNNGTVNVKTIHAHLNATYEAVRGALTQSKLAVDESLRTLLPLSYSHAYENLTLLQHFTEMEEVLEYCRFRSSRSRAQMLERWKARFVNLKSESLQPSLRSLMLHSLVLSTREMSSMILHFCETLGPDYPQLAQWVMEWLKRETYSNLPKPSSLASNNNDLAEVVDSAAAHYHDPDVIVGFISHIWTQGKRGEAVNDMEHFLLDRRADLQVNYPECYGNAQLRLGTWKQELHADSFWKSGYRETELYHLHEAIRAVPSSMEAWHSWGLMNYRIQQRDHLLTPQEHKAFVEAAHQGFVAAIARCKNSSEALPGVMRLLQLWVIHNGVELLKETVADSISRICVDHWVQVIPQLIGHLNHDSHDVREVIHMILNKLCEVHPQAVVFPLLVVQMSDEVNGRAEVKDAQSLRRRQYVSSILQHCPKRIRNEAETVAKLLVDVSAIPIEKIRENLSYVASAWNPNAEYEEDKEEVRRRLYSTLELFNADRKHLLYTVGDIGQFVQIVIDGNARGERDKVYGIVNQLVDEISKHVAEKLGKEPQKAMEPLLSLRNLSIAVFGEYTIDNSNYSTIASFSSKLDVIPSKKRPRRIQLNGSDGCLYTYCLKGNEDIRMDERVMQLFGMVNVLLSQGRCASNSFIRQFPVIPISSNVGLLGWVEHSSTVNNTICNYRTTVSNVRTHHESSVLRNYVEGIGQWEKLSIIQRTEALEFVMQSDKCEASDVARAMWHRANTAEQWLEQRTTFTTSLATMSMVGYVLGLGDRHLGNILLTMSTGKVVHIDFGDSFDVGRLRHVLPETIPFRLTRMLTNAMEVFGVDGVFRASATRTQTVLHKNRDSIMALLSAFVYDPIVQHKGKLKNVMEKSRSPQDVAERIRDKLRGTELAVRDSQITVFNTAVDSCRRPDLLFMSKAFDDGAKRVQSMAMSPEKQVHFLIEEATRVDNYSTLYFGWGPLW